MTDYRYNNSCCRSNLPAKRIWRNWQTRTVQVRVVAISWKFESSYPHQKSVSPSDTDFFYFFSKSC